MVHIGRLSSAVIIYYICFKALESVVSLIFCQIWLKSWFSSTSVFLCRFHFSTLSKSLYLQLWRQTILLVLYKSYQSYPVIGHCKASRTFSLKNLLPRLLPTFNSAWHSDIEVLCSLMEAWLPLTFFFFFYCFVFFLTNFNKYCDTIPVDPSLLKQCCRSLPLIVSYFHKNSSKLQVLSIKWHQAKKNLL